MSHQNQSNQSAAQQQAAAPVQQAAAPVQQTTALVPPTVISSQQLPAAQPQAVPAVSQMKQRDIKKEAKRIKRALRDKVRGDISAANCHSQIEEYVVAKKAIDDYLAAHADQIPDAVLLKLRSILYNPDNLNDSGRTLFCLFLLDVFVVNLFQNIIEFHLPGELPPLWRILISCGVSLLICILLTALIILLYKVPNMFERYSDKIDRYKLEALDKIIEQREQQREQELNNPHP